MYLDVLWEFCQKSVGSDKFMNDTKTDTVEYFFVVGSVFAPSLMTGEGKKIRWHVVVGT